MDKNKQKRSRDLPVLEKAKNIKVSQPLSHQPSQADYLGVMPGMPPPPAQMPAAPAAAWRTTAASTSTTMSQQIYHKKLPFVSRTIVRKIKRPKFNNLLNNFLSPFFRLQVSLRRSLFRRRKPPMSSLGNLKKWKLNEKNSPEEFTFSFSSNFLLESVSIPGIGVASRWSGFKLSVARPRSRRCSWSSSCSVVNILPLNPDGWKVSDTIGTF